MKNPPPSQETGIATVATGLEEVAPGESQLVEGQGTGMTVCDR